MLYLFLYLRYLRMRVVRVYIVFTNVCIVFIYEGNIYCIYEGFIIVWILFYVTLFWSNGCVFNLFSVLTKFLLNRTFFNALARENLFLNQVEYFSAASSATSHTTSASICEFFVATPLASPTHRLTDSLYACALLFARILRNLFK